MSDAATRVEGPAAALVVRARALVPMLEAQADAAAAQALLARADLEVKQAERMMRSVVAETMELRDAASLEKRAEWSASYALIVQQCQRIVRELALASGATAHRVDNPLQRAVRDLSTGACHVVFDLEPQLRNHGRMMLGMEPSSRFF